MPTSASSLEARRFLFLVSSARPAGNTEALTREAAAALPKDTEQRWIRLGDVPLEPFHDIRHKAPEYPPPTGHERTLADATLHATDLVFSTPLYWYSVPAPAKLYLDHWAGWMRVPELQFKARMRAKRVWAVTVISDEDDTTAEPLIGTLRLSANYLHMDWRGALIGHGNRPGDVLLDAQALKAAASFFQLA